MYKIIMVDNFNRDNVDDVLIADNVINEFMGKRIIGLLNSKEGESSERFFRLVDKDYELYKFEY